jgi:hypothetical protein
MTADRLFDTPTDPTPAPDPVEALFALWASLYRTTTTRGAVRPPLLDAKRRRLIARAVADHGTDTVEAAIRGVGLSGWHMGNNPQRKTYNDLELVLRDAAHVERFAGHWDDHNRTADPSDDLITRLRTEDGNW